MKVWIMGASALAYLTGLVLNVVTINRYGGMPVPWDGHVGRRIDAGHVVGFAPFGDNINWPPGYWTSVGDWLIIGGCLVLWLSASVYFVHRRRARLSSLTGTA